MDGSCFYSSVRRQIDCPLEYTNQHLRRQLVNFMVQHHGWCFPRFQEVIRGIYGFGAREDPGPFSFRQWLHYMVQPGNYFAILSRCGWGKVAGGMIISRRRTVKSPGFSHL